MKVFRTNTLIMRHKLVTNPSVLYIFGDNDIRKGLGGQAKEMRGEPNAIGVSTKKLPSNKPGSFKTDNDYVLNCQRILDDINDVKKACITGKYRSLVIPVLGVGMAKLPSYAPKTYDFLTQQLNELEAFAKNI